MKFISFLCILFSSIAAFSQGGGQDIVNKLPDFIPPTPEVASIVKADNLNVGLTTGSPNISIPLFSMSLGSYALPVTLNYSCTGVKVDEYASMVGMGWNVNFGGVITRTVFGKPDELRSATNNNLTAPNLTTKTQAAWDFMADGTDQQSDIFTFSFPGGSGKFLLDASYNVLQLSKQNLVIKRINNNFINGFTIVTDDGTEYRFEDAEISIGRNPSGTNCEKTYDNSLIITSWYLTKITLPSRRKFITFSYSTQNLSFESSISQTLSKILTTEDYTCSVQSGGPMGHGYTVGAERFSTCISAQTVTTKFITTIATSDGETATFIYDPVSRTDLNNGKRLSALSYKNRNGLPIRYVELTGSYQTAITGNGATGGGYQNKRLFLESVEIRRSSISTSTERLKYQFAYLNYDLLPYRLSYAQDAYGFYNGKTTNPSLIPTLPSTDINYSTFANGTGGTLVTFGNRNVDTTYSCRGLLKKIIYPTGGYDSIAYIANKTIQVVGGVESEQLAGGHSVESISSFTDNAVLASKKLYVYRNFSDGKLSSTVLTKSLTYSQRTLSKRDGYSCPGYVNHDGSIYCEGPASESAVVTSNSNSPITSYGSQHIYFNSVLEFNIGNGADNGLTEHKYDYFGSGLSLGSEHIMGNYVLGVPLQTLPDLLIGERQTTIFKRNGSAYDTLKSISKHFVIEGLTQVYNYIIKKNYEVGCYYSPPSPAQFVPFDVDRYYINFFTIRNDSTTEKNYSEFNTSQKNLNVMTYGNSAYTYPTSVKTWGSDGLELRVDRKYPPDYVSGQEKLNLRNMTGKMIEEKTYNNNVLQLTRTNTYQDWFSDTTVLAPSLVDLKIQANTTSQKAIFYSYDTYGNVKELAKENGQRISYIWDYNSSLPVANVANASQSQIAYTSFESDGKGNWTYAGSPSYAVKAPTGKKVYSLLSNPITRTGLTSTNTYIVTYWTSNASAYSVAGTIAGYPVAGRTMYGWKYFEHRVTGQTTITISGSGLIDEVRLYPVNAQMTSYTFEPALGVTSQCDANNRASYYNYDGLGRLILVQDENRNVLKKFCYLLTGETSNCQLYYSDQRSQPFSKNDCPTNYGGSSVSYLIPYGAYVSTISKDDANALAQAEIDAKGQAYANQAGYCYLLCTAPSCTGPQMKCVNSRCETGVKVITSSVQQGAHLWQCTYHYEWSDGSWSQNYVEQSSTACSAGDA